MPSGLSIATSLDFTYTVVNKIQDADMDGIDDRVEDNLLNRFRPYYKMSLQGEYDLPKSSINTGFSEKYRPADVDWFIERSQLLPPGQDGTSQHLWKIGNMELQHFPSTIITVADSAANIIKTKALTTYTVNPLETVPGIGGGNPGRHGSDWPEVMTKKNVGFCTAMWCR